MLDNQSVNQLESFIKEDLLKRLGVDGQKLSPNLKTLTGEKSKETLMVDNLNVTGMNKMNNDWISLPKVYSKKTLPVEKEEVVTPEKVSKRKYLDSIKSEITQTDDVQIGMLIGANCMKALDWSLSKLFPAEMVVLMHVKQILVGILLGQYKMLDIKIH